MSDRPQAEMGSDGGFGVAPEPIRASRYLPELRSFVDELYTRSDASSLGISVDDWCGILGAVVDRYIESTGTADTVRDFLSKIRVDELALVRACSAGSELAWERFLTKYREQLYEMGAAIAKDDVRGHELADSLYAELYGVNARGECRRSKFESYTGIGSLGGWLRTVLAQSFIDRYRYEQRFVDWDEEQGGQVLANNSSGETYVAVDPRLERATDDVVNQLSDEDRYILVCHFLDGPPLSDLASTLNVHVSTISRRIEKITRSLRKEIVKRLQAQGMSRAQAEEALSVDVRDLRVNLRQQLEKFSQQKASEPFSYQSDKRTPST